MRLVAWLLPLVDIYPQYRNLTQLVVSAHQSIETREKGGLGAQSALEVEH